MCVVSSQLSDPMHAICSSGYEVEIYLFGVSFPFLHSLVLTVTVLQGQSPFLTFLPWVCHWLLVNIHLKMVKNGKCLTFLIYINLYACNARDDMTSTSLLISNACNAKGNNNFKMRKSDAKKNCKMQLTFHQ